MRIVGVEPGMSGLSRVTTANHVDDVARAVDALTVDPRTMDAEPNGTRR